MKRSVLVLLIIFLPVPDAAESSELLYSRLTDGYWQIWSQKEGEAPTQITFSSSDKRYSSVTKKREVVYHTSNETFFRMAGGKEEKLLTDLWPVRDLTPSPTQGLFVFTRCRTDLPDQCNLWLFDETAGKRTRLTQEEGIQYQPTWSPEGSTIAYSGGSGPGSYEIFVVPTDGSGKRQLTKNQANDFTPSWSPDGTRIVFSSSVSGDYEIWIMNFEGMDLKQLTHSPGLDTRPVFSPDGTHVAFTSNRSGHLEIWVINADGSDPHPWFNDKAETCDPFWF